MTKMQLLLDTNCNELASVQRVAVSRLQIRPRARSKGGRLLLVVLSPRGERGCEGRRRGRQKMSV